MHEVLRVRWRGRLWRVRAEVQGDGRVTTQLRIGRGPLASWSSRTGPGLCEGDSVTWWWEESTDKPSFVVVHVARDVHRLRATRSDGAVFDLALGETDSSIGLRFAAVPLPPGVSIIDVKSESESLGDT